MGSENKEKFRLNYQAGKKAFEGGQYQKSVAYLEAARKLISPNSRLGGEALMWLVSAYQAAGKSEEAIALCRELAVHPHPEIRQQGKNLLYILQAPRLKRPREWMSEIPDLATLAASEVQFRRGSGDRRKQPSKIEEPIDLSQVNTKDNQFIWVALWGILLTLGGLFFLG
ncbi:MAG: tetratricopeptide repeat protein [Gomphosphaeria aponina SAG 52.96 = DSM 107014]|uniref:Tetratricopeptide repeat protein n=1 Tax=Gomphosphaeria aponina SAG 52.96 = DSM 107014 TaxID=1521640 RepID=A0A941GV47_9CHRO|nr:tetratricopeptide repeat protein [Gomphosphaeria aponina SAG 52.96 = DSM 107014]